jgi:predicted phage terminase large subunit-like protein
MRDNGARSFRQFVWVYNRLQQRTTPALHERVADWLEQCWRCGDKRLLLMVFRNAGKSTLVGLFCAWILSEDPDLRILVLSAEQNLADKMARNVRRIIERHPFARHLLPDRKEQWAADQFTVARPRDFRDPSLCSRGITGNLTGLRADVVICDDVEVPNTSDTPTKREDMRECLRELDYILMPQGTILYVGTPHSFYSIYASEPRREQKEEAPFLAGYRRLAIPLLDPCSGESIWPERFPPEVIERMRRQTGPAKFRSQMLLEPTHVHDVRLEPEKMRRYAGEIELASANGETVLTIGGRRMLSSTCWWDPSFGDPKKGDASVVACLFVDEDGDYWLHGLRYLTHDPAQVNDQDEADQLCRQVVAFAEAMAQPSIRVETNGIGKFLPSMLRRAIARAGAACTVVEHVSTRNKVQRILDAFDPLLAAGRLHVHENVWQSGFVQEMREWLPDRESRDDALDAVAGCILEEPVRLRGLHAMRTRPSWRSGRPTMAITGFDP